MTEEQMTLIKTLIKKHGISATDGEWTLVFLGASYGLTEKQIDSYLIADTSDLLATVSYTHLTLPTTSRV